MSIKKRTIARKKKPIANLPPGVGVCKIGNGTGGEFWRARLGSKFTGGAVQIRHFSTLEAAAKWIDENKSQRLEIAALALTSDQLADSKRALAKLPEGTALEKVVDYYLSHARPNLVNRTVAEITVEFLTSRRAIGCRPKTITQYESYLRVVSEEWGKVRLSTIEQPDIEDWLAESEWSPRTRKNYLVTLTTLFSWAQQRKYCGPVNPAASVARPILDDKPPGILTVEQATALLMRASADCPQMVPGIAIGLFAGLRRSEICALDWSEVDLVSNEIEVKGTKAKTRQRRLVSISSNLASWLLPHRQDLGPVAPRHVDTFGKRLRVLAGPKAATETTKAEPAIVNEWPHNALRHSFGSYYFGRCKNENFTAGEMGNTPDVIFKHYRALVRPEAVERYWSILPPGAEAGKVVAFSAA